MIFFLIFFSTILLLSLLDRGSDKRVFLTLSLIFTVLFQGFRAPEVGTDLAAYLPIFHSLKNGETVQNISQHLTSMELGYLYLNKAISLLNVGDTGFLIIISLVIHVPLFFYLKNVPKDKLLSLFFYYCVILFAFSFSGLRQAIAVSIVTSSFVFLFRCSYIFFYGLVLLASSFHVSALVALLAHPASKINISNRLLVIIGMLGVIFFFLRESILKGIVSISIDKYSSQTFSTPTNSFSLLIVFVMIYIVSHYASRTKDDKTFNICRNIFLIAVFIQVTASVSMTAMRAGFYFLIVGGILLERIYLKVAISKHRSLARFAILALLIMFFFYTASTSDLANYDFVF